MALAGKIILSVYVLRGGGASVFGVVKTATIYICIICIGQILSIGSVVVLVVLFPVKVSTRIDKVNIADCAIECQTGLVPVIGTG